jgi:hypothetical protein
MILIKNLFESFLLVAAEKNIVQIQGRVSSVHSPVKTQRHPSLLPSFLSSLRRGFRHVTGADIPNVYQRWLQRYLLRAKFPQPAHREPNGLRAKFPDGAVE